MPRPFRHAICNEVFEKWKFPEACKAIRRVGYTGIEIAPFTLAEDPAQISQEDRRHYKSIIESEGLTFVGLHWLMVSPGGLHVTTPDEGVRKRSWLHIRNLIDLCADLAGNDVGNSGVMIFGSPKQRCTTGGLSRHEATKNYIDGIGGVASHAEQRGVTILVEALPSAQCDVITTLAEAASIVDRVASPAVRTMFDTHNAADETEPHAALVERYLALIRHIHVNELDGTHPGTGEYDFKPVLEVLRRHHYKGWISLEVFDFTPGAEKIAADSLAYLQEQIEQLTK